MMIPPFDFSSSAMRFTMTRSCNGRIFIINNLPLAAPDSGLFRVLPTTPSGMTPKPRRCAVTNCGRNLTTVPHLVKSLAVFLCELPPHSTDGRAHPIRGYRVEPYGTANRFSFVQSHRYGYRRCVPGRERA